MRTCTGFVGVHCIPKGEGVGYATAVSPWGYGSSTPTLITLAVSCSNPSTSHPLYSLSPMAMRGVECGPEYTIERVRESECESFWLRYKPVIRDDWRLHYMSICASIDICMCCMYMWFYVWVRGLLTAYVYEHRPLIVPSFQRAIGTHRLADTNSPH